MYFRMGGRDERERYQYNYQTVLRYLTMKCQNKNAADFFKKSNMTRIAIYGLEEVGQCLIQDLQDSDIHISYIVDAAVASFPDGYLGIPVIGPDDIQIQEHVDVIVVTVLFDLNRIVDLLQEKNWDLDKIINISDVVYSL